VAAIANVGEALAEDLAAASTLSPKQIRKARADRFYAIGRMG
jgi:acetyl-CoA carboxylase carboxyl transferase subunit alpha